MMKFRHGPEDCFGNIRPLVRELRIAAASNAAGGRTEEAKKAAARLRQLDPALRVSNLRNALGPYPPQARSRYEEAMRQAGLERGIAASHVALLGHANRL
jgi:hypothetical protein